MTHGEGPAPGAAPPPPPPRIALAALLQALPDAVVVLDAAGGVLLGNTRAARLLGVSEAALPGQRLETLLPALPSVLLPQDLRGVLRDAPASVLDRPLRLPLHRPVPGDVDVTVDVELTLRAVDDRAGDGGTFLGVLRDAAPPAPPQRTHEHDQRARRLTATLVELGQSSAVELETFLALVTETVARALGVARVSVWGAAGDAIVCDDLFELSSTTHSRGLRLDASTFPSYFEAIRSSDVIVADDARSHPATSCFRESYLTPLGIWSMLDVPLRSFGGLAGVLCVESTAPRAWSEIELRFCADAAAFVVQALALAERRRHDEVAQREIDERNRRLRSLSDAIPDLLFSVRLDGRIALLKSATKPSERNDLLVAPDEIQRHTLSTLFSAELAQRMSYAVQRAVSSGELQTLDYDLLLPQGRQWFEARLARMSDDEATVIVRNTTPARDHAAALAAERERLQALLASSSAIIHSSTVPRLEVEYVSDSFEQVLGFPTSEVREPRYWERALHPDDRARVLGALAQLPANGHLIHEYRLRHADGSWRWLRDGVRLLPGAHGEPARIVGASVDITTRKRDEARIATVLAMQQLVARVSAVLLAERDESITPLLREALASLTTLTGAERCFLVQLADLRVVDAIAWSRSPAPGDNAADEGGNADALVQRLERDLRPSLERLAGGSAVRQRGCSLDDGHDCPLFVVPMLVGGTLRGAIGLCAPRIDTVDAEELLAMLELFADTVSAGLQRLADERALRSLSKTLADRAERQRSLLELSVRLSRATTLHEVYAIIHRSLPTLRGIDHIALAKRQNDGRVRVRVFAQTGADDDRLFSSDVLLDDIAGTSIEHALATGAPVTTNEHDVQRFRDWRDDHAAHGRTQVAVVPLLGPQSAFGAIHLASTTATPWTVDELSWLVQFAVLVGGHLSTLNAGEALRSMNEELERRVDERTVELRASEERFELLFQSAPQAMVIAASDGRVVQANLRAQTLFGYDDNAFTGLPIDRLLPHAHRAAHAAHMRGFGEQTTARARAMAPGRTVSAVRADGREFSAEIGLVPLFFRGEMQVVAGITDVSARVAAQEAVTRSLREKEVLLKEIHHRVKNNLQIISSLLMLQSDQMPSDAARSMLHESVYRVRSMALIHQLFYGGDSLDRIDVGVYARGLATSLAGVLAPTARVEVLADDVDVAIDRAVPLGLVLNELLTNAFKYGLRAGDTRRSGDTTGDVVVEVRADGEQLRVSVWDSGPGLPEGFDAQGHTLGLQLVRSLTRQLRGAFTAHRTPRAGVTLTCPRSATER